MNGEGRRYRYDHVVTLDETNVVGNVYFAHYLHWQGRCRERFLADHAPDVLAEVVAGDLALITLDCAMNYDTQSFAFDHITVSMGLVALRSSKVAMDFRFDRDGATIARGTQSVACMRLGPAGGLVPTTVPDELAEALEPFRTA